MGEEKPTSRLLVCEQNELIQCSFAQLLQVSELH